MLFQTLVQLNILILATPALAGWIAMPVGQHSMMQAACIVMQSRAAESAIPARSARQYVGKSLTARTSLAVLPRVTDARLKRPAASSLTLADAATAAITSFHSFPHAIRAP